MAEVREGAPTATERRPGEVGGGEERCEREGASADTERILGEVHGLVPLVHHEDDAQLSPPAVVCVCVCVCVCVMRTMRSCSHRHRRRHTQHNPPFAHKTSPPFPTKSHPAPGAARACSMRHVCARVHHGHAACGIMGMQHAVCRMPSPSAAVAQGCTCLLPSLTTPPSPHPPWATICLNQAQPCTGRPALPHLLIPPAALYAS